MKHSIILIVGDAAPQYAELTNEEIAELWRDVQTRCLPKVSLGWFDDRMKWTQLSTNPTPEKEWSSYYCIPTKR